MKTFDPEALSKFTGKDGQPCYIAHKGKVIDVSESKLWKTGMHMKRHAAGKDLTADIGAAPHGPDVLDRYPQAGIMQNETAEQEIPTPIDALLAKIPFLRRHPHPMAVHFPMAFFISPAMFYVIYLITGMRAFEATAFHCLAAGILFLFPAAATGLFAWWVNYQAKPMQAVKIKIVATIVLLAGAVAAIAMRIQLPGDFAASSGTGVAYFLLLLAFVPIVSIIGYFGGSLTFPVEHE